MRRNRAGGNTLPPASLDPATARRWFRHPSHVIEFINQSIVYSRATTLQTEPPRRSANVVNGGAAAKRPLPCRSTPGRVPAITAPFPGTAAAPPIDFAHLREQTCDDADLQAELLDLFAGQAQRIVAALSGPEGETPGAAMGRADLLHTLCGSARAVGAWEVAGEAERLERAARGSAGASGTGGDRKLRESVARAAATIAALGPERA